MIRLTPCALLALAACSSEPERNQTAAIPAAPPAFAPAEVAATPTPAPAPGVKPRPGELKTFGDWIVGCDNTLRCELRSLGTENEPPGDVTLSVARDAGPAGKLEVTVDGFEDAEVATAVDGKRAGTPAQIVAAMANGRVFSALSAGKTIATLSLRGASAALRYVDAAQGRAGTVTASVAKGLKPASAVPAAPTPPTISAVRPGGDAVRPTAAQLADMRRTAQCDADAFASDSLGDPQAHALGGGETLVLLPCSAGAYNLLSAVFVLDGGAPRPVRTDAPVGFDETGGASRGPVPTVVNGDWKAGVLTSYAKARGLGDCGVYQDFVWDGERLRLSGQREMGECRGNIVYITTWRANVVRR